MSTNEPLTPSSAVPLALQQALPKWFTDRPATTEAIYNMVRTGVQVVIPTVTTLYGVADVDGYSTGLQFAHWLMAHWFGLTMGALSGGGVLAFVAKGAFTKASTSSPGPAAPAVAPGKATP